MADKDFFDEATKTEETTEEAEPEKIKVGEKEYTEEELAKRVGLGEVAEEYETKWNTKIDSLYKGYTQATQEKKRLEEELESLKVKQVETKAQSGVELSPEELRDRALAEAKEIGLVSVKDVDEYIDRRLAARELLDDTEGVVSKAKDDFGIDTSVEDLITHMQETGIKNPEKAFKDLYEDKIDKIKEERIGSIKKPGMVTDATSSAGAKTPSAIRPNDTNIDGLIEEVLARE